MDFELSEELAELQATVRRLAQDKVRPRARDIDESGEYPQDLFEVFRDAGFHGLLISVTIKRHPIETVHQLREAGAIKPVYGRTAPEVRNAEETLRRSHQVAGPREAVR